MSGYIPYQRRKWERAQKESRTLTWPLSATEEDKTPVNALDWVLLWNDAKQKLKDRVGIYKNPDGTPAVLDARTFPLLTMPQANALRVAFHTFGTEMQKKMQEANRSTLRMSQAGIRMLEQYAGWIGDTYDRWGDQKFLGQYLYAGAVRDLFDILDRYAIEMSAAQWSAFNIKEPYEMMLEAIDETSGGWMIKWAFIGAYKTIKWLDDGLPLPDMPYFGIPGLPPLGALGDIMKWATIGGGLFLLYWYVLKPKKRGSR